MENREHNCSFHRVTNFPYGQTLDELSFERGIWQAALDNNVPRIEQLLRKGISASANDSSGFTALHYAARSCHLEAMKVLLENKANPNAQTNSGKDTPLHRAAYQGSLEACRLLLNYSADLSIQNCDGQTALHKAAERGYFKVFKLLLEHAPSLAKVPDKKGRLPKDLVPKDVSDKHSDELKELFA